jgi:hypothetical protein
MAFGIKPALRNLASEYLPIASSRSCVPWLQKSVRARCPTGNCVSSRCDLAGDESRAQKSGTSFRQRGGAADIARRRLAEGPPPPWATRRRRVRRQIAGMERRTLAASRSPCGRRCYSEVFCLVCAFDSATNIEALPETRARPIPSEAAGPKICPRTSRGKDRMLKYLEPSPRLRFFGLDVYLCLGTANGTRCC